MSEEPDSGKARFERFYQYLRRPAVVMGTDEDRFAVVCGRKFDRSLDSKYPDRRFVGSRGVAVIKVVKLRWNHAQK